MAVSWLLPATVGVLFVGAQLGVAFVSISQALLILLCILHRKSVGAPRTILFAVLALIFTTLVHVAIGTEPVTSWSYATHTRVLLILLMVGSLASQMTPKQRDAILLAALTSAAISAAYSLYQVVFQTTGPLVGLHSGALPWVARNYRSDADLLTFSVNGLRGTGLIHHVLSFAHVSCILALAAAARALFGTTYRLGWALLGTAASGGLFLSGMRAGLVGWSLGLVTLLILKALPRRRVRALALSLVVILGGGSFIHVVSTPSLRNQVGSFSGRMPIWTHARKTAVEVFPRGLGYGAYPHFAERTYPQSPTLKTKVHAWAHNMWLTLAVEAPLAIFAWIFFLLALLQRALTQAEGDRDQGLGAMVLATAIAWLFIGLFHDSHFQREYFPLLLGLWGLGLSPSWTFGPQVGGTASPEAPPRESSVNSSNARVFRWNRLSRQEGR